MKTADDPRNPVVAAYSLCIFGNIADAGVTAAGDDRETFFSAIDQRGIVKHIVRLPNPVYKPLADWRLILKTVCSRDFAQKEKPLGKSCRDRARLQPETRGELRLFYRSAYGFSIIPLWPESIGMSQNPDIPDIFRQIAQAPGMIVMTMAEYDRVQLPQINLHCLRVTDINIRIAGVKQYVFPAVLNIVGDAGFGQIVGINSGSVVSQNSEFHSILQYRSAFSSPSSSTAEVT